MENIHKEKVLFSGRTSIECLTDDIVRAVTELRRTMEDMDDVLIARTIETLDDPVLNCEEGRYEENGMSISHIQYLSCTNRYFDRVDEFLTRFTGYKGYRKMIERIASDNGIPRNSWDVDALLMRNAFSHNIGREEGCFECDDRQVSTWAWMAFSDALSTIGDMTMLIIRMRVCLRPDGM